MSVVKWSVGLVLAMVAFVGGPASAQQRPSAVLELFTSQGCSSCPPADRYIAEMADRPDVIALTLAVDYWDYLGWRDTLANPIHAKRQKAYAYMRGDRQIYTPQMIINGVGHAIGSDRAAIQRVTEQSRGQPGALSVPVSLRVSGDTITLVLPASINGVSPENPATIFLFGVSSRQPVDITRGENRGQTMIYRNVVRSHANLGEWGGGPRTVTISRRELVPPDCEKLAILVQTGSQRRPGVILGASMIDLPGLAVH
ncbi:DUF1223 domain-containing protein [Phreatobacter oligotrophus]|uniref:Secreted protein n=1 Tax=Phreatobacter oligotrophus TaxID=1122261 RepID=A0A2T4YYG3_9HYPH|nr:DUF1223 domain-containing protein [Phreatobacter oligotrophus]PTM51785.1 hypothetical protein C8P69_10972 [Phreatobacter oligotrophus]